MNTEREKAGNFGVAAFLLFFVVVCFLVHWVLALFAIAFSLLAFYGMRQIQKEEAKENVSEANEFSEPNFDDIYNGGLHERSPNEPFELPPTGRHHKLENRDDWDTF